MFLRTLFLEGMERRKLIYDINPPRRIYQFSSRVTCAPNGDFSAKLAAMQAYAWYVWEKDNKNKITELNWIG